MSRFFAALFLFIVVHIFLLFPAISKAQTQPEFAFEKQIQLDLSVDDISYTIKFSDLNIEGGNASQNEIFAAIDAGDEAQLRKILNAASILVPLIEIEVGITADESRLNNKVRFENLSFRQVKNGIAQTATIKEYRESQSHFLGRDDPIDPIRVAYHDVSFAQFDILAALLEKQLITQQHSNILPLLYAALHVERVEVSGMEFGCTAQNVVATNIVAKNNKIPGDVAAALLAHDASEENPELNPDASTTKLIYEALFQEVAGTQFDAYSAQSANCTSGFGGLLSIQIDQIVADKAADGRLGNFTLRDIFLDGEEYGGGVFSLGELTLKPMDFKHVIENLQNIEDFTFEDLANDSSFLTPQMDGIAAKKLHLSSPRWGYLNGSADLTLGAHRNEVPTKIQLSLSDMMLGVHPDTFSNNAFHGLLEKFFNFRVANINLDMVWQEDQQLVQVNEISVDVSPGINVQLNAQLSGADSILFSGNAAAAAMSAITLKLDRFEVKSSIDENAFMYSEGTENRSLTQQELELSAAQAIALYSDVLAEHFTAEQMTAQMKSFVEGKSELQLIARAKKASVPVGLIQFIIKDPTLFAQYFEVEKLNFISL
ncbi:hypothetical protein ATL17_3090 [Maritalea mobilis]|uniref:Uncharacterized protein n=1 Tax=Maritalea mobilis TaxID=483324 RepID=A0A4R6VK26_9HYPH|nr:hypothetical protein [Maritalea mobilis]TDQ61986.1 hypothetical protein ATL17_3090 [Maritalea mobilis]